MLLYLKRLEPNNNQDILPFVRSPTPKLRRLLSSFFKSNVISLYSLYLPPFPISLHIALTLSPYLLLCLLSRRRFALCVNSALYTRSAGTATVIGTSLARQLITRFRSSNCDSLTQLTAITSEPSAILNKKNHCMTSNFG